MIGLDLDLGLAPHLQALESRKQNALEAQRGAARGKRADAHHWVRKVSWAMLAWERHTSARHPAPAPAPAPEPEPEPEPEP